MRSFRTAALLSCTLSTLALAPPARAVPWSVSVSVAGGHLSYFESPTSRLGLEIGVFRSMSQVVGLGLEVGAWEELGARSFTYAGFGRTGPNREHDRDLAMSALLRLSGRVGHAKPHVMIGVGEYLTAHRRSYGDETVWTSPEYSPGFSVGVGLSRCKMPTPVVAARWHRVYTPSFYRGWLRPTTDRFLVSAGVSFD